jgi:DNA-binding MurR/RpiR family transcriptional regulator
MNILGKLIKLDDFSSTEQIIAKYLLAKRDLISTITVNDIARDTFCSPATITRFCQKMGTSGFREFKMIFVSEIMENREIFTTVDYNVPFSKTDSYSDISKKFRDLHSVLVKDSCNLLTNEVLNTAVTLISNARKFFLFSHGHWYISALSFQSRLERININPVSSNDQFAQYSLANLSCEDDCAVIIAYNGNKQFPNEIAKILKEKRAKIIAVTANNGNSLSKSCNLLIPIPFYENSYTRLSYFSSQISVNYTLDVLYSCLFKIHYDKYYEMLVDSQDMISEIRKPQDTRKTKNKNS